MDIKVLTLFPDEMRQFFLKGIFKKGFEQQKFGFDCINLRDFSLDKHQKVDDYLFGGGQGMLMKADVIYNAVTSIPDYDQYTLLYPCPKGSIFNQEKSIQLFNQPEKKGLIFLTGYYEGVDDRIFDVLPIEKISIGDVVLSSGELPSLMIIESVLRQIPGVLGNPESFEGDSIISGFLEYPNFTHPRSFLGRDIPDILLSGHHKEIAFWKKKQSYKQTLFLRPSLFIKQHFSEQDHVLVTDILKEDT